MDNMLKNSLVSIGIEPDEDKINKLNRYYEMLVEKNKVMNLTAITEYEDVVIKHFIDSLAVVHAFPLDNVNKIIDVGTGAGFPGIVLKTYFPKISFTLLDSLNKRIKFLDEVKEELKLDDLENVHGRAEDYAHRPKYREQYDLCVSRAVANLATLSEYCLPFVKKGGYFISYKAKDCMEEINSAKKAIDMLGGQIKEIIDYTIPGTEITRTFVVIHKIKNTSSKYPRKAGCPSKEPLK